MSILEAGTEIKEKETVGQEFIEWAEKYWHLDKLVKTVGCMARCQHKTLYYGA